MPTLTIYQSPPTDHEKIRSDLQRLNPGEIRFDRHNRQLYSTDASLYQVEPIGVVIPKDMDHVAPVLAYCAANGIAVLPRGGGTSLGGQCANAAIVLDLSANGRRILSVAPAARRCVVEPGISIDELNRQLLTRAPGLFFAPDPATAAQCAIGGCIGGNAAGARSLRYGRTSENLAEIELLLSDGRRVSLGPGAGRRDPAALRLAEQAADVVRKNAEQIRARFPKLVRRNAGYGLDLICAQLDRGVLAEDLDLSGLICGSEGTLGVVVAATLKLHPLPLAKALAIATFDSVKAAIAAVKPILATNPSAVELLDDVVLRAARGNPVCSPYVDLLPRSGDADPRAALYIEYQAEVNPSSLEFDRQHLLEALAGAPMQWYRDPASMASAWTLRKSGEALLHGLSDTQKPVTFVEDNAVPVENLPRFVEEFSKIVAAHGTTAAYWAHASVGVLHIRPMLNLHDPRDLEKLRSIAVQAAALARQCGGVMSGEHGDGRVRGPLLESFFGAELMNAFREIKTLFDPAGILNPGMIVGAGPIVSITENLRVEHEHADPDPHDVETFFDYEDQEGFGGAVDMCNGAGFCRKTAGGTMCPSYRATLDERHSTRGRGNALRLAITGQVIDGRSDWSDPATMQTLDLCLSCKACKTECPSNVDMSRLKAEYTAQRYRTQKPPLAALAFGHIRLLNRLGSLSPGAANWIGGSPIVREMLAEVLDISPRRRLPAFDASLYRWFGRRKKTVETGRPRVVLFGDCFTTYSDTDVGKATVSVVEKLGYAIEFPRVGCCGRALISTGLLRQAIATADCTLAQLAPFANDPNVKAIVVCEPSCLSAMKDDWLQLKLKTGRALRQRVAEMAMLPEEFVGKYWDQHPVKPNPRAAPTPVIFHGHCHQKALWGDAPAAAALRRLAGDQLTVLASGCCGMAGSFGYTANHYDISMKIGELSLFPPLRLAPAEAILLAAGTSCRHQIHDGVGRGAEHPIQWIDRMVEQLSEDLVCAPSSQRCSR